MKASILFPFILIIISTFIASCSNKEPNNKATTKPAVSADTIYQGGDIITINDAQPAAEAIAVKDGKIIAVGSHADINSFNGPETKTVDLQGKTLIPGFVDSHGHAYLQGIQATTANLLPAPDGTGNDIPTLIALLKDWAANNKASIEKVGWVVGFGYDDSQLAEQRHPTRDDLDQVSTEYPVLIIHQSGHLGVANSKALELAGVTSETENPKGGVFRHRPGSKEPNGVAEEYAFFYLVKQLAARFDDQINEELVLAGAKQLASFGYTTGQEGRATAPAVEAMQRVAKAGKLNIDLVAYPDILEVENIQPSMEYSGRFRVGGAKLTIDGSPQGKTAWLSQPYYISPEGRGKGYRGYAAVDQETVDNAVEKAYANGWQILTHANGDAASDSLIRAITKAKQKYPELNNRPVLIHGQVLRREQVTKLKALSIFPSLFPMHTYYWGDWHRDSVLGPKRAEDISPTGWVLEEGMKFGTHHDAPVALPDSMRILSATVTRTTRSGKVLGPNHRVPVMTALKAMTLWSAWQSFEEKTKGSIEIGKLADFVVLSENPMKIPKEQLANIKVLQTIKEDNVIYQRPANVSAISSPAVFGFLQNSKTHDHSHHETINGKPPLHGDGCFGEGLNVIYQAINSSNLKQ
ncbi:amidohydrolase [Teredinibacter sp. KSP-S5-2]|uniref:amidohydrolase n=1 Tax=Teredinibacter sp. KSP-S5-2 TaxID=3034506 RepID=UPI002934D918|nr:amidohydrolase [Teredinibacter sp. KSP-S5-2]WNO07787.1 amidohydrolase [Teredinibacter sp. KSP-S5-2]